MASAASMPAYLLPGVPVHQPSHLEGDASLATEILPGPPSLVSAQQSTQKRDPRKSTINLSYLPPSDPGSTYSGLMHGTALISQDLEGSRTKRTRVDKSSTTGRAQRASARHQNGALSTSLGPALQFESPTPTKITPTETDVEMIIDDEATFSRSTSSLNILEPSTASRSKRKEKGKGKDTEPAVVKIKEEPKSISLLSPEPPVNVNPPRKPAPSFLASLVHHVETSIPTEFQLPEDVRNFFKDVGTGPKGAYVDTSEIKQPRLNRHGQLEDREPHRLRDRNGYPVLCFRCGTSALPSGLAAAPVSKRARRSTYKFTGQEGWKSMISCDYCNLHWHLDCLDPPLPSMPLFNKKWMCPNHAERVLPSKRRIPKQNAPPLEITAPRQFNNGNVEVIQPEAASIQPTNKLTVDEVLINGRRYRVPERILVLDFWSKINAIRNPLSKELDNNGSGLSSPLTSLSSLEDLDEPLESRTPDPEAIRVAQALCLFKAGQGSISQKSGKKTIDVAVQTGDELDTSLRTRATRGGRLQSTNKRLPIKSSPINGAIKSAPAQSVKSPNAPISTHTTRRKRSSVQITAESSTRELRSRSKNDLTLTSASPRNSQRRAEDSGQESIVHDSASSMLAPHAQPTLSAIKPINIKVEESDLSPLIASVSSSDIVQSLPAIPAKPATIIVRRTRSRRSLQKEPDEGRKVDREKRGRKRKERDDEMATERSEPETLSANTQKSDPEKRDNAERVEKVKKRVAKVSSSRQGQNLSVTSTIPPSASTLSTNIPSAPTTPSLKIRLPPRLGNTRTQNGSPKVAGAISSTTDTPSKL
ncbi:hypothetical protein AX16_004218 [Volvariella volvacea WC 439]|nr:hypothetical protein AX16_004218 [Volvariella volvacea WC 439]